MCADSWSQRDLDFLASTDGLALQGLPAPLVVVAEDDDEFRDLLVEQLERAGLRVQAVDNGNALLSKVATADLRVEPPDLVITDNRMPGCDGLDALELMQRVGSNTPVILITGFGDRDTIERAHELGAVAVFSKPFDLDELRRVVVAHLDDGGAIRR